MHWPASNNSLTEWLIQKENSMRKMYFTIVFIIALMFMGCGLENAQPMASANQGTVLIDSELKPIQTPLLIEETTEQEEIIEEATLIDIEEVENMKIKLIVGEVAYSVTLANNSSTEALLEMLQMGPITIDMRDYASMEKVGPLGTSLPRNDEQITTEPGDIILYQGNALVIYYAPNSWDFTRIGKIDNVTEEELKKVLGSGDVKVTLSLN